MIVSLPLVSLLGIIWLWRDTGDAERIAGHAEIDVLVRSAVFCARCLLVLPGMLRAGVGFWPTLGANCVLTIALYFITAWALAKFGGINL